MATGDVIVGRMDWSSILCQSLSDMRDTQSLCDVVLVSKDGKQFHAHSAVLAAASSYLGGLLSGAKTKIVMKTEIENVILDVVLRFIYQGHSQLSSEALADLEDVGKVLQLNHLVEACQQTSGEEQQEETLTGDPQNDLDKANDTPGPPQKLYVKQERKEPEEVKVSNQTIKDSTPQVGHTCPATPDDESIHYENDTEIGMETMTVKTEHEHPLHKDTSKNTAMRKPTLEEPRKENMRYFKPQQKSPSKNEAVSSDDQEKDDSKREKTILGRKSRKQDSSKETTEKGQRGRPRKTQYICSDCGKHLSCKNLLISHEARHRGEKPFVCDSCGVRYLYMDGLRLHKPTCGGLDSRGRPVVNQIYLCQTCGQSFVTTQGLRGHQMTHTGEKPFQCTMCPRRFRHRSNVKLHERVHAGERPYKCIHCDRGFLDSSGLKRHVRTHTGEKPYMCSVCPSAFTQRIGLRLHAKKHHPLAVNMDMGPVVQTDPILQILVEPQCD